MYNEIKVCPKDMECITYSNKMKSLKSQYSQREKGKEKKKKKSKKKHSIAGVSPKLDIERFVWSS